MSRYTLHHGDCREVTATLDAESVDAVVCDPPYGLSFMGKGWDHGVPGVEFWVEALRVAKPGAHLLAFGGTRTYHRLACAIEDAGWEIRDCVMWVYGSGFPKSLDVSKALDKLQDDGTAVTGNNDPEVLRFTTWLRSTGVTRQQIREVTGTFMDSHYLSAGSQPAIPTPAHWALIRPLIQVDIPDWAERAAERAALLSRRKVLDTREMRDTKEVRISCAAAAAGYDAKARAAVPITAPATDAARQWSGWGTALKPAWEPIIVARKPLCGTVAENVLRHGTGGINVDGCRVGMSADDRQKIEAATWVARNLNRAAYGEYGDDGTDKPMQTHPAGRWPANVIHDGSDDVVGLFPETTSGSRKAGRHVVAGGQGRYGLFAEGELPEIVGDTGSAARFFYCAKASREDRGGNNHHPTVKPTALMRYLCRLVTPPGGVVLDPFTGSGSTGKAAIMEGFRFVGIEREAEYVEIARARIAAVAADRPLLEATA